MKKDDSFRRLQEALEEWDKPLNLPKPSGEWLSCRDARDFVRTETGDHTPKIAERALARRAHIVPTRVSSWSYHAEPQEGIERLAWAKGKPDLSDWSDNPTRGALSRRWAVLKTIGDDPSDYLIAGEGLISGCWTTGDFTVRLDGDFSVETVSLINLAFDGKALREVFELSIPISGEVKATAYNAKSSRTILEGGRPALKHGDVIAALTLRLVELTPSELRSYTAEALAVELEDEYRLLGEAPPAKKNATLFASGILRVLRSRSI